MKFQMRPPAKSTVLKPRSCSEGIAWIRAGEDIRADCGCEAKLLSSLNTGSQLVGPGSERYALTSSGNRGEEIAGTCTVGASAVSPSFACPASEAAAPFAGTIFDAVGLLGTAPDLPAIVAVG